MLKNYLKIAFRSFWKQKLTSAINIIGLSIGIACASLGFVFIQYELSYDQFHDKPEQIYWLSASIKNKVNLSNTPGPLAPQLKQAFPEVSASFRMEQHEFLVQSEDKFFKETGLFVDPNFFSFFSFELMEGVADQVFTKTNSIVLSKKMARKYFGEQDPVGRALQINYSGQDEIFEVTGVAADAPSNSSLQYTFLLPIQFQYQNKLEDLNVNWDGFSVTSFIRLKDDSDLNQFNEKLPQLIADNLNIVGFESDQLAFQLRALKDYHLRDQYTANGLTQPADMSSVRILGIIAVLILLVACLNFMNLANAKSSKRLSEVGIRKVLGAIPKQLVTQLLAEAILMSMFSLGVGIILIETVFLPLVLKITGIPLHINWLSPIIIFPLLGITIITGILAGLYPSIILSRLNTVQTFQSTFKTGGDNLVTKGSLVFQFALSIGLLSCTFIMYGQQQYIQKRNLGFNKEEIIVIPTQADYDEAPYTQRLLDQFKFEVIANSRIIQVSGVSHSFGKGNAAIFVEEEDHSHVPVFFYTIDTSYIPLLNIQLLEGQNFTAEMQVNNSKSILVNEAFLKHFNITQIENYQLPESFGNLAGTTILGVVKDYNYMNLKSEIRPLILQMKEDAYFGNILVKIDAQDIDKTLAQIQTAWQKINPSKPFEFSFLDEDIQQQYVVEERWEKAVGGASLLAILISCLGLFGLIALILAERTKEIGIRKILGASVSNIFWLFSRQFLILLSIASFLAIPVAWWSMQKWLENFAYKIEISFLVFLVALCITLLLALLTAGFQTTKAAIKNPVEALRQE